MALSDEGGGLLHGELPLLGQPQPGIEGVGFFTAHPGNVLLHALPGIGAPVSQLAGLPFQAFLKLLEQIGFENFSENLLPVLGGGQQQLEKIPLGDHGDLHKLVPIQSQDLSHGGIHLPGLGDGASVGHQQPGLGALVGGAGAVELGPLVFRAAAQGVALPPAFKFQLHKSGGFRCGVFGAEHPRAPVVTAGLAVEGEGNGVKQGGFPRAGVAGDEVQPLPPQILHIQNGLARIGAEGGKGQLGWPHGQFSSIRVMSSSRNTSCCAVMGWLFCNS